MENLFNEILSMSIDAVWLIGAVIIVRALLYKAPKYFRKILWGLVGLRLLIPFSFKSSFSLVPEETPETVDRVVQQTVVAPAEQSLSFMNIVAIVWVTVGVAFLGYGIISYLKLKSKIFDGVLYKENIYFSDKIESPFVCGFIKPKIYLPYGLKEETEKYVLQHEKMHIKHGDHILKYLGFGILCIHWFNPFVWISYFLLCKDIELSCDESVVRKYDTHGCKQYAKALLELGINKVRLSACPIAFGEVGIKNRIKNVVNYKKAGKVLVCASLTLCIAVAVCFMTEPEVKAKENVETVEVSEETTEPVTENVKEEATTEPATQATTEAVAEPETEAVAEVYEPVEEATIDYEELADKMKVKEEEMLEEVQRHDEIIMSEANKNNQSNLGSNSSVIGTKPNDTVILPSFNWDPAVTVQGGQNYQHTRPYNPNNPNDQFYMW